MPLDQLDSPKDRLLDVSSMSFGEHLEELRYRLILALIGPAVAAGFTLYFGRELVGWLVRPLAQVLRSEGLAPQTYNFAVTTGFFVYAKVALVAAVVLASPWIVYQIWKFVSAGLYSTERKAVMIVAPFSGVMTVLGVLFLYYVLLPFCLVFLIRFSLGYPPPDLGESSQPPILEWLDHVSPFTGGSAGDAPLTADEPPARMPVLQDDPESLAPGQMWVKLPENELRVFDGNRVLTFAPLGGQSMVAPMIEIGDYINFVTMFGLAVIVGFQLPVVMLVVGWSRLVDPAWLAQYRKYAFFICFVIGAALTPADPISLFPLSLSLWGLYELGLLLMRLSYRSAAPEEENG